MNALKAGFRSDFKQTARNAGPFLALATALSLSACGPSEPRISEAQLAENRQAVYQYLEQLEDGLSPTDPRPRSTLTGPLSAFMTSEVQPLSDFDLARTRRVEAFERLSNLDAPADAAPDFNDFWELHQAYRYAVETGRAGHGQVGLIYSRPYPGDHLSSPMVDLLALLSSPETETQPVFPGDVDLFAEKLRTLAMRLDLDLAAGIAPPAEVVAEMARQIETSPFASSETLRTFREQMVSEEEIAETQANEAQEVFTPTDRLQLLDRDVLLATQNLKDSLAAIQIAHEGDTPPAAFGDGYLEAVVAQASSGEFSPQSCLASARDYQNDIRPQLLYLLSESERQIESPDEDGAATSPQSQTGDADQDVIIERSLSERFVDWQVNAPLFPPEDAEEDPEAPPAEASETPEQPYRSPQFVDYMQAIDTLKPELGAIISGPLPPFLFSETGAVEPVIPRYGRPPEPPPPPALTTEPFSPSPTEMMQTIRSEAFSQTPVSLAVIDTLLSTYLSYPVTEEWRASVPDVETLADDLPNPAYTLGWPHFVLHELSGRGVFDQSPRLEFARLFRIYQIAVEAEVDILLASGEISHGDASERLINQLGMSPEEAAATVNRLRVRPGLRCGELAGLKRFSVLLQRAQGLLGSRFNYREFNDVILSSGSRPLKLVERDIDTWLSNKVISSAATVSPE